MSSGVGVNPECLTTFEDFKMGKKYRFVIFGLSEDNTEIMPLIASNSQSYDDFISKLPEADCRWAVYDFEYQKEDGGKRNKICFYSWSPDGAKVKSKMMYASSKDALRRSLVGVSMEFQCTDFSEVALEIVLDRVSRTN